MRSTPPWITSGSLDASGPDRRVPDPNVFHHFDRPVGCDPVMEVKRARLGVENATSGLDLCGMQRDLRAMVPSQGIGEPVTDEGQRREGAQEGKRLDIG